MEETIEILRMYWHFAPLSNNGEIYVQDQYMTLFNILISYSSFMKYIIIDDFIPKLESETK